MTFRMKHWWECPPVELAIPARLEDALHSCANGEAEPDTALMQLLVVSRSEEQAERMLGSAIWDALETSETRTADRLGAVQKLWDGAKGLAANALRNANEPAH